MILSTDNKEIKTYINLENEYGLPRKVGRYNTIKGKYLSTNFKIIGFCDNCGKKVLFSLYQIKNSLNKNGEFDKLLCKVCKTHETNLQKYGVENTSSLAFVQVKMKKAWLQRYGVDNPFKNKEVRDRIKKTKLKKYGDEVFNNKKKAEKTCLQKYGIRGVPRNKSCKRKISEKRISFLKTEKGRKYREELSKVKKALFKDKRNHPLYGKKVSEESKLKNRISNIKTWTEKILRGDDNRNYKGYESGIFFSKKMNCNIYYRSSYERYFYFLLEYCKSIEAYYVEKMKIPYVWKGLKTYYIPDVLIQFQNGLVHLIEIKPRRRLMEERNLLKLKAMRKYVNNSNYINRFFILDKGKMLQYIFRYCEIDDLLFFPEKFKKLFFSGINNIAKKFLLKRI